MLLEIIIFDIFGLTYSMNCYHESEGKIKYYCLFGINYKLDGDVFEIDNYAHSYPSQTEVWNHPNIMEEEFYEAASPFCSHLRNMHSETFFFGALVRTKNGTYEDMFMACCENCPSLKNIDWVVKMKMQMFYQFTYGIKRSDDPRYQTDNDFWFTTVYLIDDTSGTIGTRLSTNYDIVPTLFKNKVGFVAAYGTLDLENMLERFNESPETAIFETLAPYSSALANKYKHKRCKNAYYSSKTIKFPENSCFIYATLKRDFGLQCCCYGNEIARCQERVLNAITTGSRVDVKPRKIVCIIDQEITEPPIRASFTTERVQFDGEVYSLLENMEREEFCELHLSDYTSKRAIFTNRYMRQRLASAYNGALPYNIDNEYETDTHGYETTTAKQQSLTTIIRWPFTIITEQPFTTVDPKPHDLYIERLNNAKSFRCINASRWDPRSYDIIRFCCVELLPMDAQCPFEESRNAEHYHIMCCCGHRSFCNYNANFLKKAEKIPKRCEYSNEYQYYLHDHFHPVNLNAGHTCLLHFARGKTLQEMDKRLPEKDTIIYFLPGSAIWANDLSYALLNPNECDYIDVEFNAAYLRTRFCHRWTSLLQYLDTYYMPFRIFACRCNTTTENVPCDRALRSNIAEEADKLKRKYYCAKYEELESIFLFNETYETVENEGSPYCVTVLRYRKHGDFLHIGFDGGIANRTVVRMLKFNLGLIPFAMHALSGESSELCVMAETGNAAFCFCRSDYREVPCNALQYERSRLLELVLHTLSIYEIRKEVPNKMIDYMSVKFPEWCPSADFVGSIIINALFSPNSYSTDDSNETAIISSCLRKSANFSLEESRNVFCDERVITEECFVVATWKTNGEGDEDIGDGAVERNLLCCCVEDCDFIGTSLYDISSAIKSMKNKGPRFALKDVDVLH